MAEAPVTLPHQPDDGAEYRFCPRCGRDLQRRLLKAIAAYHSFIFFDTVYIGGGNAKHVDPDVLPENARIVDNTAGILGGVRLWDMDH